MLKRPVRLAPFLGTCILSAAITALSSAPASADPCQDGGDSVGCGIGTPGGGSGGGTEGDNGGGGGTVGNGPGMVPGTDGGGAGTPIGEPPPPQEVNTLALAERARSSAQLPTPALHTSPNDRTYVRLRTGLWVDGFVTVQTAPISAGGQTVVAVARPERVVWELGESQITCETAGRPNSTECSYTYRRSSASIPTGAHSITATVVWGVHWTCTGTCDATEGDLEDLEMVSLPEALVVGEVQTNTNRGRS